MRVFDKTGFGADATAPAQNTMSLRAVVNKLRDAFVTGFKSILLPNPLTYYVTTAQGVMVMQNTALPVGLAAVQAQMKALQKAGVPDSKVAAGAKLVVDHANSYIPILREMVIAGIGTRPRSELGAMMQIKKVAATWPKNSLIVERWIALEQIVDVLSDRHGFPFNNVGKLNRLKLHGDGALNRHTAFEDDHLVGPDSPEAEWYFRNDSNQWNRSDKLYGGDSGCWASFMERTVMLRVVGYDPCDLGNSLLDQVGGISKGGGNWIMMIIQAGAAGTNEGTGRLKLDMLMKRNVWCYENGVTPPTYPQIGQAVVPEPIAFSVSDLALKDPLAEPVETNVDVQTGGESTLPAVIAGAGAGFLVGGPPGLVVGGLLAAVMKGRTS